jgi:hypothetical protein
MRAKKPLGERVCKDCGATFEAIRPIHRCKACINLVARRKRAEGLGIDMPDDGYLRNHGRPVDIEGIRYDDRLKVWRSRARYLEKELHSREEWRKFFREDLERIYNDKPLWANLTRDTLGFQTNEVKETKEPKVIGRPTSIEKRYLDTRDMNWEDFDSWGFGLEEDM